jgi:hypothetical protein
MTYIFTNSSYPLLFPSNVKEETACASLAQMLTNINGGGG